MPRQNRVTPEGEIVASAWRGAFMGNRGILHDEEGALGTARWRHPHWITCTLNLRPGGKTHPLAAPGRYTALFFPDEAIACAAGHRPCAECRRPVFGLFKAAWGRAFNEIPPAAEIDRILHAARLAPKRRQATYEGEAAALPFGAVFRDAAGIWLRTDKGARAYAPSTASYGAETAELPRSVTVLTPAPLVAVMAAGWRPAMGRGDDQPGWPDTAPR